MSTISSSSKNLESVRRKGDLVLYRQLIEYGLWTTWYLFIAFSLASLAFLSGAVWPSNFLVYGISRMAVSLHAMGAPGGLAILAADVSFVFTVLSFASVIILTNVVRMRTYDKSELSIQNVIDWYATLSDEQRWAIDEFSRRIGGEQP